MRRDIGRGRAVKKGPNWVNVEENLQEARNPLGTGKTKPEPHRFASM